jgi:hypothetical protein
MQKLNGHGLARMDRDLKKYFIVLNKIKFGMGGWVIREYLCKSVAKKRGNLNV